ncbi:MAG: hypothetical protein ABIF09_00620 [Gemmatimonadota bacterium]
MIQTIARKRYSCPEPSAGIILLGFGLRVSCLLLLGCIFWTSFAVAQERTVEVSVTPPEQRVELTLIDGSVLIGRVEEAGDPFRFVVVSGIEMTIPLANVRAISQAKGTVEEGEYWPEDPNRTRLFFGPTARTIPKGQGYLAVYEIVMPFLGFGITDNFILAGGTPLVFGGGGSRPFWVAPKLRVINSEKTQGAVGVLAVAVEDENFGLLYGVVTHGTPKSAFSLGVGYGFANGDLADSPAVMVGGEVRTGRGLKLVTENYLFPGGTGLVSFGPRFFGRKLSADLGLVIPLGFGEMFGFPLVNFVYNF